MKSSAILVIAVLGLTTLSLAAWATPRSEVTVQEAPNWLHFDIDEVRAQRAEHGRPWQEFVRVPDLFAGVYEIPAGGEDGQSPHDADEVYHVLEGRGTLVVEGDRIPVQAGSVVYVAKDKEHRFVDITEDLSVLVFFATPSGGGQP
jgi:mannose-6-phosphate isomerase-like protein (cupin superfamily)